MNGSGHFRAGKANGQRIQYDGTNIIMSASTFYLGGGSQYISGSSGNLEISSSGFHLDSAGNVTMSGSIVATDGTIGSFHIASDSLRSGDSDITDSANQFLYIKASDDSSVISLANGGAVSMTRTSGDGTGNAGGIFLKGDGTFRLGKAGGQRIENDGSNLIMSSSKFFLGGGSQYVSGSNGNIEISSSGFYLDRDGNATLSGSITAGSGQIATFSITSGSIESSANAKRGLKFEPGDSIRGYGNTVHSTETIGGKYSFAVGAVSTPAGAGPSGFKPAGVGIFDFDPGDMSP